jgi:hypothetical protein
MQWLVALGGLLAVGAAAASSQVVLPRPPFPAPATGPGSNGVRFQVVSSVPIDPARLVKVAKPRGLAIEGRDGATRHLVESPLVVRVIGG